MHKFSIVIIISLFLAASAPWLLSSCSPRPLLPHQLKDERSQYETRAASAQQATLDALRSATSPPPKVVVRRTVKPADDVSNATLTSAIGTETLTTTSQISQSITAITPSGSVTKSLASSETSATSTLADSTVKIIDHATITQTSTPMSPIIIVHSTPLPDPSVATSASTLSPTGTLPLSSSTPNISDSGKSAIEDVITNEMLSEQVQKNIKDNSLSDIVVKITPDGMRVSGKVTLVTLLQRPFEMTGTFVVENESLAVKVDSILLNGSDVTEQYRSQLEDEIRWQLYQLLPQRFVQSFDLLDGQITVQSHKR